MTIVKQMLFTYRFLGREASGTQDRLVFAIMPKFSLHWTISLINIELKESATESWCQKNISVWVFCLMRQFFLMIWKKITDRFMKFLCRSDHSKYAQITLQAPQNSLKQSESVRVIARTVPIAYIQLSCTNQNHYCEISECLIWKS